MKSTAVLIYDSFCSFIISVALEMLALAGKTITVFAQNTRAARKTIYLPWDVIVENALTRYRALTGKA